MSANPVSQVITANALSSGDVVYLTADGDWSVEIVDAAWHADKATAETVLASAASQTLAVVDAHLAAVEITANGPVPVTRREALRAAGPSIAYGTAAQDALAVAIAAE
ncbi:DUF2849 domain-containing protein [Rhodobacteraceae bacterium D3-12]|nr:DUF2849 domain-containing protein [Rhodobacteraceae bacterium D3-12]